MTACSVLFCGAVGVFTSGVDTDAAPDPAGDLLPGVPAVLQHGTTTGDEDIRHSEWPSPYSSATRLATRPPPSTEPDRSLRVYSSPQVDHIHSQINPVHTITPFFFQPTPRYPRYSLPLRFYGSVYDVISYNPVRSICTARLILLLGFCPVQYLLVCRRFTLMVGNDVL